jgi:thiamine-phosphate diphosphorylase
VLREKDLPRADRVEVAAQIRSAVDVLLVGSDPLIPADGVHLAANDPMPDPRPTLVGRSCHDADDIARALAEGCDYVTVSPVFESASKPGYGPPLGVAGLRELSSGAEMPIYALGGVTPGRARLCMDAGAHGVAVMGVVMRARHPAETVADLLSAITAAEVRR